MSRFRKLFSKMICNEDKYLLLKDELFKLAKKGALESVTFQPGKYFERVVQPGPWYQGPDSILGIPPTSKTTDTNRWSGGDPDGKPGNSGYYVGEPFGVRAEVWHYGALKDGKVKGDSALELDQVAFDKKIIFELALTRRIDLIDISKLSSLLDKNLAIKKYFSTPIMESILLSNDYSVARGIAHGIYLADVGYDGVFSESARGHLGMSGDNAVLFDSPGSGMTRAPFQVVKMSKLNTPTIVGNNFVGTFSGEYIGLTREEVKARFKLEQQKRKDEQLKE